VTPKSAVQLGERQRDVGVSAFGSYQERKSSNRGVSVEQYAFFDYAPTLSFLSAATVVNAPPTGALMALPSNIGISDAQIDRERINGMVTFQWAPSDSTTVSVDAMYTSNKQAQDSLVPGMWFSRQFSNIEFNGSDIVATPVSVVEPVALPGNRGKDLFYANYDDNTLDESHTIGLGVNHHFSDAFSMGFDAATSTTDSGGDGPNGLNSIRMNVAAAGAGWQGAYWGNGTNGNHRRAHWRRAPWQWQRRADPRTSPQTFRDRFHSKPTPTSSTDGRQVKSEDLSVKSAWADVHRDACDEPADRGLPGWLGRRRRSQPVKHS
jgi:hypothetical protein